MERSEWLRQMRRNAEALYDRFAARYWVTWGMTVEETHRIYLRKKFWNGFHRAEGFF